MREGEDRCRQFLGNEGVLRSCCTLQLRQVHHGPLRCGPSWSDPYVSDPLRASSVGVLVFGVDLVYSFEVCFYWRFATLVAVAYSLGFAMVL